LAFVMEFAYDHIQEETVASGPSDGKGKDPERPKESLNEEFQEAYRAISASPWGAKFGSFIGTVKKQVCFRSYVHLNSETGIDVMNRENHITKSGKRRPQQEQSKPQRASASSGPK
jgi:hypothetical protein